MYKMIRTAALSFATAIAAILLVGTPHRAIAAQSGETEANRAAIAKGLQAWADGTGSPYDLLAPNVRWTIAGNSKASRTYPSKEAFMREVIRPFNARMKERLVPAVHRIYADGDTIIAHFDAKGVALDGKPYVNSYAWILRMANGEIVEATAFFDAHAFDDLWTRVAPTSGM